MAWGGGTITGGAPMGGAVGGSPGNPGNGLPFAGIPWEMRQGVEKLLAEHPAIGMAAVVGVPDERLGEVGRAYVVLRPGVSATETELIAWSRENMANYKVPRSFVLVDDLPRNAAGKVLKTELRSQ